MEADPPGSPHDRHLLDPSHDADRGPPRGSAARHLPASRIRERRAASHQRARGWRPARPRARHRVPGEQPRCGHGQRPAHCGLRRDPPSRVPAPGFPRSVLHLGARMSAVHDPVREQRMSVRVLLLHGRQDGVEVPFRGQRAGGTRPPSGPLPDPDRLVLRRDLHDEQEAGPGALRRDPSRADRHPMVLQHPRPPRGPGPPEDDAFGRMQRHLFRGRIGEPADSEQREQTGDGCPGGTSDPMGQGGAHQDVLRVILGLPGETGETAMDTIRFALRTLPNGAQFNVLAPYPGTELYETLQASGALPDINWRALYQDSAVVGTDGLSKAELNRLRKLAYTKLYF